jgi:NTE family protein
VILWAIALTAIPGTDKETSVKLAIAPNAAHIVNRRPRVGLVLGAGGLLGGAWLVGALHAIASETGWDPGKADYIVGTSAGSMVGGLIACGVPPWFLVGHAEGETFAGLADARDEPSAIAGATRSAMVRPARHGFSRAPGSWRLGLASMARPHRYPPGAVLAGWLPHGTVSTEPLKDVIRRACPSDWSPHPNFWAVSVDYATGRRIAFGRPGSPTARLSDAVAASCAVPGFYRPVTIRGRSYVDGGVYSASNLDVLRDAQLDVVLALSPMSSPRPRSPRSVAAFALRKQAGRRLEYEAERLRAARMEVLVIQPTAQDLEVMGNDMMSTLRRHDVVQTAVATMTQRLHGSSLGERLAELRSHVGRFTRPPDRHESTWLGFTEAAHQHWAEARAA